jgi:HAD superfamily hydrolase (TIGR01459 family)
MIHNPVTGAGRDLSANYPVWLCDLWGVVHDGQKVFPDATDALVRHREAGGCVILITNAPRPRHVILPQMKGFGVPDDAWDDLVSSGDVTRELVKRRAGSNVFHLGPPEDAALLEGLPVNWTGLDEAQAILCTGLNHDGRDGGAAETPEDYRPMLTELALRRLPFICANPDRIVGVGGRLYPCAGSLADIYEEAGGSVEMAGKPYAPIYQVALQCAGEVLGRKIDASEVLAIGDGLPTDVEGARANNMPIHFITGGIHVADHEGIEAQAIASDLMRKMPGLQVAGVAAGLVW